MKMLLVYPEIQSSVTNTATYSLPLGLGAIATFLKRIFDERIELKILDGSMMTHDEQLKALRQFQPDFIGLSPTIASLANAYALAEQAKETGALVVFGGVNATNLWRQMLTNRRFVDAIVLFEGEEAMAEILRRWQCGKTDDQLFRGIPNVAYCTTDGVVGPDRIRVFRLTDLPDIDYSLFDLPRYFQQTEGRGFGRAVSYYAGKGCAKRSQCKVRREYAANDYEEQVRAMKTCSFCGRNELGWRVLPFDRETAVLRNLHDRYGVRGFFNVQDTVNLAYEKPVGLEDSWFRLFIGAESITPPNIRRLQKRYGSDLILQVGIESADPAVRSGMGKVAFAESDIIARVELLARENIQLHASFIFGGRGETRQSMETSARLVRRLASYENVSWILISPQIILPGSPDYRLLLQASDMTDKWGEVDLIDIPEIHRDFLRFCTSMLTRSIILEEIATAFADIRAKTPNRKLVLDIKGVMPEEERAICPRRYYCD